MSGPRDKYDTRKPGDEGDVSKPLPPDERWRIRIQDEIAADVLFRASIAYNAGRRTGFELFLLDEMAHMYRGGQLSHERLRLDRDRWNVVARTLVTFMRAEWIAQREAAHQRDQAERAATTRRIVQPMQGIPSGRMDTPPKPGIPSHGVPGALARRGALYGG